MYRFARMYQIILENEERMKNRRVERHIVWINRSISQLGDDLISVHHRSSLLFSFTSFYESLHSGFVRLVTPTYPSSINDITKIPLPLSTSPIFNFYTVVHLRCSTFELSIILFFSKVQSTFISLIQSCQSP